MRFINKLLGTDAKASSEQAKDRLRIIVESNKNSSIKQIKKIQEEIFDVLAKHLSIPRDDLSMQIDEQAGKTVLELSVHIPKEKAESY